MDPVEPSKPPWAPANSRVQRTSGTWVLVIAILGDHDEDSSISRWCGSASDDTIIGKWDKRSCTWEDWRGRSTPTVLVRANIRI